MHCEEQLGANLQPVRMRQLAALSYRPMGVQKVQHSYLCDALRCERCDARPLGHTYRTLHSFLYLAFFP